MRCLILLISCFLCVGCVDKHHTAVITPKKCETSLLKWEHTLTYHRYKIEIIDESGTAMLFSGSTESIGYAVLSTLECGKTYLVEFNSKSEAVSATLLR